MRFTGIKAQKIKPIELFEVSDLSEVVVIAGPNGVGKSKLIASILAHLRNTADISCFTAEATTASEEKVWGKKFLNTALPTDRPLLQRLIHQNQRRRKYQSSILNFER